MVHEIVTALEGADVLGRAKRFFAERVRPASGPVPLHAPRRGGAERVSATLPVRVMVQDAWDEVRLDLPPATTLGELKRRALDATRVVQDPDGYMLKFRGAELKNEAQSLAEAGLVPNGALIVLPRRRRPVR